MFIPDPSYDFFPFRIQGQKDFRGTAFASKNLGIKLFQSSQKHDPGCSSQIRILIFNPARIQDPGVKHRISDPGSGSATLEDGELRASDCSEGELGEILGTDQPQPAR
jgi:hypothetical protein